MPNTSQGLKPRLLRRIPKQERSRERIDEILKAATDLIGSKGIDAVTMKEIATRSGGPIASVYQYFPNKSAIVAMLYERHAAEVKMLVEATTSGLETIADAFSAVEELVDLYYCNIRDNPALQDLVNATQADKALALLDLQESRVHSRIFADATCHLIAQDRRDAYARTVFLMLHLAAAAVRLALLVDEDEGKSIMAEFKAALVVQLQQFIGASEDPNPALQA